MLFYRTPEVLLHVLLISSLTLSVLGFLNPQNAINNIKQIGIQNGQNINQKSRDIQAHAQNAVRHHFKVPIVIPLPHLRRPPIAHDFLIAHNKIRAKYGVPPLKWDRTLARFARHHASTLVTNCSMVHSDGQYGENLFWGKLEHWTPTKIVEDWANEAQMFNLKEGKCTQDWTKCGHFTQVIWKDTARVGCHYVQCQGKGTGFIGICDYDPPGNYENQNPLVGKAT